MRYWGYLAAKLGGAALLLYGLAAAALAVLPHPAPIRGIVDGPFGRNLGYTVGIMFYAVICGLLLMMIVWDHRLRCRTCLRRLRMPLATGSWTQVLLSRPRTEYICPYGHGTLKVEELQITGHAEPDWQANEDMWKELLKK
jgi:hypothetical protein